MAELRKRVAAAKVSGGRISVREVLADVRCLHADRSNAGALFQVASQFNLLEMVSPSVTPEQGIDRYEDDRTQGPACAITAGAGTIYRNYFVNVNGHVGQSSDHQIDCLRDLGNALGNTNHRLWNMRNGYALPSNRGLTELAPRFEMATEAEIDQLRGLLRVGIQWNTEVTISESRHTVSQVYCAALPIAYTHFAAERWSGFARLILEAAYEASFCVGILNRCRNANRTLYLTLLGGGAFGNKTEWILAAIERSLGLYQHVDLDVVIVSYGHANGAVRELIQRF